MDMTMDGKLSDELIPSDLREICRKVYTSVYQEEDERVKIALISLLSLMREDTTKVDVCDGRGLNVVPFVRTTT